MSEIQLSILICTTRERQKMFDALTVELINQKYNYNLEHEVEILFIQDNKEISVGKKRQQLLEMAKGKFIVFFDDDDWPYPDYVKTIYDVIVNNPGIDCVGMPIDMTTNGRHPQRCCHSLRYSEWADNFDGWDYVRNCTHFNPCLREIALQAGFKDMRIYEDKDYSDRVSKLLKNEYYIDKPLFHYRFSNKINYKQKYGITK